MRDLDISHVSASLSPVLAAAGRLAQFPAEANWQEIADRLFERNCDLEAQNATLQKSLQQTERERDLQIVQARGTAEIQTAKMTQAASILRSCQALNQEQLRTISGLSASLKVAQERLTQLERECLALQATCRDRGSRANQAQRDMQRLRLQLQEQCQQTRDAQLALERQLSTESETNSSRSNAWPPPLVNVPVQASEVAEAPSPETPAAETNITSKSEGLIPEDLWEKLPEGTIAIEVTPLEEVATVAPTDCFAPLLQQRPPQKSAKDPVAIDLPQF